MNTKYIKGVALAILAAVSFGFMPIFASYAYSFGSNAVTVVFLRHMFSAIGLFIILKAKKVDISVDKKMMYNLFFCGVIGSSGTALTLFLSYQYISIGLATILHYIYPVVVSILSFLLFGEEMNRKKIISLLLSVCGVYILVGFAEIELHPLGVVLAIASGLFYSVYILQMGKSIIRELESKILIFYISVFSAITTLVYGVVAKDLSFVFNYKFNLALLALIIVSTLGLVFIAKAVKTIGPTNASILSTFEPITTIAFGCLLFRDRITPSIIIGSILIIVSIKGIATNQGNIEVIENEA